jgi:hypothetical protein
MFFVQFSAIYFLTLVLFKFFPERARLREDTVAVFNLNNQNEPSDKEKNRVSKPRSKISSTQILKKRLINRRISKKDSKKESDADYDYTDEDVEDKKQN